jgi:chromosome segregation ATPase
VGPAVFNTDVIEYLGQAGSIPVRLRQPPTRSRIAAVPDSNGDIETRVAILEREVVRLREQVALSSSDAAGARVLAAGADRDVSEVRAELRAHTQALNALRETQLEQGRAIAGLDQKVTGLDQRMTEGFATLGVGKAQITALLTGITGSGQD